jgi:hypothetical protein
MLTDWTGPDIEWMYSTLGTLPGQFFQRAVYPLSPSE